MARNRMKKIAVLLVALVFASVAQASSIQQWQHATQACYDKAIATFPARGKQQQQAFENCAYQTRNTEPPEAGQRGESLVRACRDQERATEPPAVKQWEQALDACYSKIAAALPMYEPHPNAIKACRDQHRATEPPGGYQWEHALDACHDQAYAPFPPAIKQRKQAFDSCYNKASAAMPPVNCGSCTGLYDQIAHQCLKGLSKKEIGCLDGAVDGSQMGDPFRCERALK